MNLPKFLPKSPEDRNILAEFYQTYDNRQWFDSAVIIEDHPTHMKKTLEITAKYNPAFELKDIITFASKYNLAYQIIDISKRD